jgi:hypothetical protein
MIPSYVKVFNQTIPDVGIFCIRENKEIAVEVEVIGIRDKR